LSQLLSKVADRSRSFYIKCSMCPPCCWTTRTLKMCCYRSRSVFNCSF